MQKALRACILLSAIAMLTLSFLLVGCAGGPNENQLQVLEETKAAALAAEEKLADCQSEKRELESQLADAKQKVERMNQEKADVLKRLEAM